MKEPNKNHIILSVVYHIKAIIQRIYHFVCNYQFPIFISAFIIMLFVKKVDIKNLRVSDLVVIIPLILLLISPCCSLRYKLFLRNFGHNIKKERVEIMRTKFVDHGNLPPDLTPKIYGLREPLLRIFSVPKKNSVGTNDINNAISNLTFQDDKVLYTVQKKDFLDYVSGGAQYHTVINDEYIGYTQERRFILFNYRDNTFRKYTITTDGYEYVSKVQVLDWEKRLFVFEVLQTCLHYYKKFIRIFYLNGEEQRLIKEGEFGTTLNLSYKWQVYNKCIFFHYYTLVEVYDENLNKIAHPLVECIQKNEDKFNIVREMVIHPYLPFAVIIDDLFSRDAGKGYNNKMWVVRWEHPDKDEVLIPFFPYSKSKIKPALTKFYIINIQFSPDGKWLVLYDESDPRKSDSFVAIPVKPDNPKYFGPPKLLGKHFFHKGESSTTWVADPTSFVACYGGTLYKWELDRLHNSDEIEENDE